MHLKHLLKQKIDEPIVTFSKSLIAMPQVFISTGILRNRKNHKNLNISIMKRAL